MQRSPKPSSSERAEASEPSSDSPAPPSSAGPGSLSPDSWWQTLIRWQITKPLHVLAVAAVLVSVSLVLAVKLEIRPGFEALLPRERDSVRELERVKEHTAGVSTVFVVLEGDAKDTENMRRLANDIVTATREIGRPWVGAAESGVHEAVEFLEPRAGIYGEIVDLQQLHDDIEERYDWEVGKVTGAALELEDDYVPPHFDADCLRKRFGVDKSDTDRYPDGYYQSQDGTALVVAIRSGVLGTDYEEGEEAIARIQAAITALKPTRYAPSVRVAYAGDLVTSSNEYKAINDDLTDVGLLGALLIISVVFLYYLRARTLLSMVVTIGIGVSVTFGMTQLLVGHLNMATGFLFTIIAGNGINPGIIFMARFLEARRKGTSAGKAIHVAHGETWLPTLSASCAASAAYASLMVTEFRGFRDFGVIGGFGMVLCWMCTFAFLPSILIMTERISPLDKSTSGLFGLLPKAIAGGTRFGAPFATLVRRFPRACTTVGAIVAVVSTVFTVRYIQADPMEYDLRNLRSDMSRRGEEERLTKLAERITGYVGQDGMAILVDERAQVPLLKAALEKRRDTAPAGQKPFKAVHTLQDFIPTEQTKKIPLLLSIKDKLHRSRMRGFIDDEDWTKLSPYLPPDDVAPFTLDDLPDGMARAFTERDGRRGRVVYISPISTTAVDDAHYLFRWSESYRRTDLGEAGVVLGSGRAVIYADIWRAVLDDIPKAVLVSLLLTLLVVAISFRAGFAASSVMLSLLAGIALMTGLLSLFEVKLNFLNFIALPITFGIGVDYAVNVMQRYRREGPGGAITAVRETGGAVVLCSMTTTLGYLALVGSVNYAVRSLGTAAVLGEIACLLAAVIVLPAALTWRDQRRANA